MQTRYILTMYLEKADDRKDWEITRVNNDLIGVMRSSYEGEEALVSIDRQESDWFGVGVGCIREVLRRHG